MSNLEAFGRNLAVGWIIYLILIAQAKLRGQTWADDSFQIMLGELASGDSAIVGSGVASFVGASIVCFIIGYGARRIIRPLVRKVNAWLNEPVKK